MLISFTRALCLKQLSSWFFWKQKNRIFSEACLSKIAGSQHQQKQNSSVATAELGKMQEGPCGTWDFLIRTEFCSPLKALAHISDGGSGVPLPLGIHIHSLPWTESRIKVEFHVP